MDSSAFGDSWTSCEEDELAFDAASAFGGAPNVGAAKDAGSSALRAAVQAFPFALKLTLPLMAGFACCGLSYGVYSVSVGLDPWVAPVMALSVFAGSAEFVVTDMLGGAFAPLSVFLVVLMINARHLFYGISMLERYREAGALKPFLIYGL